MNEKAYKAIRENAKAIAKAVVDQFYIEGTEPASVHLGDSIIAEYNKKYVATEMLGLEAYEAADLSEEEIAETIKMYYAFIIEYALKNYKVS